MNTETSLVPRTDAAALLRAQIHRTRRDLADTLDQLRHELAPRALLRRIWARIARVALAGAFFVGFLLGRR